MSAVNDINATFDVRFIASISQTLIYPLKEERRKKKNEKVNN